MKFLLKSTIAIVALLSMTTAASAGILISQNNEEISIKGHEEKNFDINLLDSNFKENGNKGKYQIEILTTINYIGDSKNPLEDEMLSMEILFFNSDISNENILSGLYDEESIQTQILNKWDYSNPDGNYNSNGKVFYIPMFDLNNEFKKGKEYKVVLKWEEYGDKSPFYYSNIYNFSLPNSDVSFAKEEGGIDIVYEGVDDSIIQIDLKMTTNDYNAYLLKYPDEIKPFTRYVFDEATLEYSNTSIDLLDEELDENTVASAFVTNKETREEYIYWSYQINLRDIGIDKTGNEVLVTISYRFNSENISAGDGDRYEEISVTPRKKYKAPEIIIKEVPKEELEDSFDPFTELLIEFSLWNNEGWPDGFEFYSEDEMSTFNSNGKILPEELIFENNIVQIDATLNGEIISYGNGEDKIIFNDVVYSESNSEEDWMLAQYGGLDAEEEYPFNLSFIMGENAVIEPMKANATFFTQNKYDVVNMDDYIDIINIQQEETVPANEHNASIKITLPGNKHPATTFEEFESLHWEITEENVPEPIAEWTINKSDGLGNGVTYYEYKDKNGYYLIDIYENGGNYLEADTDYSLNIDFTMSQHSKGVTFGGTSFKTNTNSAPPITDGSYEITTVVELEDAGNNTATTTFSLSYPAVDSNEYFLHSNNIYKMEVIDGKEILGTVEAPDDNAKTITCVVKNMKPDTEYKNIKLKLFLNDDTELPVPIEGSSVEVDVKEHTFTLPVESFLTDELEAPIVKVNSKPSLTYTRNGNDGIYGKESVPKDTYTLDFSIDMWNINNINEMNLTFTEINRKESFTISIDPPEDTDEEMNFEYSVTFDSSELSFKTEYSVELLIDTIVGSESVKGNIILGPITTPSQYGYISTVPKINYIGTDKTDKSAISIEYDLEELMDDEEVKILYTWKDDDGMHTLETNNKKLHIEQVITVEKGNTISDIKIEIFGLDSFLTGGETEILYDTYYYKLM